MERILREVYGILYDLDKLTEDEYNKLISVYGKKLVDKAIEDLIFDENDERNLVKFNVYLAKNVSYLETTTDMSIYEIYLTDVSSQIVFDAETNDKYMNKILELIQSLESLFMEVGCDNSILPGKRVPWIAEKINYCLKYCSDSTFLNKLNKVYKEYCYYRDMLVAGNLRLVIGIASEYHKDTRISFEDIIQWGNVGLMRAVEKFKSETGAAFSTCAGYWIRQNITSNMRISSYPLRLPLYLIYENYNRMTASDELSSKLGRNVTSMEVLNYTGDSSEKVGKISMFFADPLCLDETVESRVGDVDMTRADFIPDERVDVCRDAVNPMYRDYLEKALSTYLTTRELEVLKYKIGLNCECMSGEDIAVLLGLSEQRISQLWNNGIKKLAKVPNIRKVVID